MPNPAQVRHPAGTGPAGTASYGRAPVSEEGEAGPAGASSPGRSGLAQAVPGQAVPGQAGPGQAGPGQAGPGQAGLAVARPAATGRGGADSTTSPDHTGRMPGQGRPPRRPAAAAIAAVARELFAGELPVRIRAWDGSEAGPPGGPVVVLSSRQALRRILWQPGELGLARAYVTGELDVDGDLGAGLQAVWRLAGRRAGHRRAGRASDSGASDSGSGSSGRRRSRPRLPLQAWPAAARAAIELGIPGPRPPAPAAEARISGRRHSRSRDRAVIAHHYDVPATFYELILDPAMAYSCALWLRDEPGYTLADAQRDKLDRICRQLRLSRGRRLLDVGCGWGSLTLHAAARYRASVTAVTLSAAQAKYVQDRVKAQGLTELVTVRTADYRDIRGGEYDAVAAVEMGEHVGDELYPAFCAQLHGLLRPGGRLFLQQMSRGDTAPGGGRFIEAYIAADMHMRPVGETISLLERAGLEVRQMTAVRAHYARTIRAWNSRLEQALPQATALIGPEGTRVWRLYLTGAALAFDAGRMGVHQIVAARPAR
jgi:cyclopropane-fatty-acyl-phospholipid synthase